MSKLPKSLEILTICGTSFNQSLAELPEKVFLIFFSFFQLRFFVYKKNRKDILDTLKMKSCKMGIKNYCKNSVEFWIFNYFLSHRYLMMTDVWLTIGLLRVFLHIIRQSFTMFTHCMLQLQELELWRCTSFSHPLDKLPQQLLVLKLFGCENFYYKLKNLPASLKVPDLARSPFLVLHSFLVWERSQRKISRN